MCMYVCVCHLLPGECFSSGLSLVFLFYFLKIIFPFRNKLTRKPAPLPPRRTGPKPSFKNRADFPSHPQTGTPQDSLGRLESLPVWWAPWWRWRPLCHNGGFWLWDTVWFLFSSCLLIKKDIPDKREKIVNTCGPGDSKHFIKSRQKFLYLLRYGILVSAIRSQ